MKMATENTIYINCDNLRDKLYRNDEVLLLDCRSNDEYRHGHINGAHNIVLPQLMMRRLKANKLSLKSLVPPNFRQEKEAFLKKCTTSHVVVYDHFTADLNNNDTTMLALLYNRMKNEGCNVTVLKGGYTKFQVDFPDFCLKAGTAGSSDADDEDGGSDESAASSPRGGRCSPLSPLTIHAPSILGLGSLRISCDHEEEESDSVESRLGRTRRDRPCDNHRHHNCLRHSDRFNSEGESDDPNSANSLSSNEGNVPLTLKPIPSSHPCTCCSCDKAPRRTIPQSPQCPSPSPAHNLYGGASAPAEILNGLFLGCAKDASNAAVLAEHNITYILNVTPNLPNVFENDGKYKYKQIPITDHWSQNLSQFFPDAIAFIDEARSKNCGVLVHCLAGISRSVTVTVAYLMQKLRWSLNDAYDFVKQRKNNVSPNFNFMGQLLDFEKTLGLGEYSSSTEDPLSSASQNHPPTLFFTSPPPPTPTLTLPVMKGKKREQRSAFILPNLS
uniref:Dual specificity phosphatase n=1 Tax=Ciona intestinalis TaxID=7719 RepID=Q4H3P3_CIOIN|nr:dual specificity phosphatase [Ciona intestinalis]BAE06384.1 dual specificity phosphatase [Ciona intestinalis]|eukprot:NP_001071938.1 dual specificity phosphatase [Ciona intestinalis]